MAVIRNPLISAAERWASGLRFPRLLMLTAALFALDLVIPDVIPFADELVLALVTLLLASLRRARRGARAEPPEGSSSLRG